MKVLMPPYIKFPDKCLLLPPVLIINIIFTAALYVYFLIENGNIYYVNIISQLFEIGVAL